MEKIMLLVDRPSWVSIRSKTPDFFSDKDVFSADVDLLSVKNKVVTPDFVRKAHQSGKEVHVWGKVDDKKEMIRLKNLKVDNIITDYPDRWFKFLNE